MQPRYRSFFARITLFFFTNMVCYSPVYAQKQLHQSGIFIPAETNKLPVTYVTEDQVADIIRESQLRGYTVKEGTLLQLAELEQAPAQVTQTDTTPVEKEQPCDPDKKKKANSDEQVKDEAEKTKVPKSEADGTHIDTKMKKTECPPEHESTEQNPMEVEVPIDNPAPYPQPEPLPPPQPPPPPEPTVHTNVGIYADVSYGSGRGGSGDAGKVFFIVAGIMVIAAFIVYAGKYIADIASGKEFKTWWEFIFSNTYLSTRSGQHGRLNGLKIATGFVSSDLLQVALVGEAGNTDIDVILNEYTPNEVALDFSATYWLLGASARLHLSDKLVNASYLYLDFMGGKTSHGSTDTIGMARFGASFGVNDYVRLGASIGAYYLGLDEDQGFANNGDNYWTTFGFEMGVKF